MGLIARSKLTALPLRDGTMVESDASRELAASLSDATRKMLHEEIRREWRGGLNRFWLTAAVTVLLASGIPFAKTMSAGSGLEVAPGELVRVQTYPNETRVIGFYAFTDAQGRHQEARASMEPGERTVGDKVEILYNPDDLSFSRPLHSSEYLLHFFFIGITAFQAIFSAGVLAWVVRVRRFRENMLRTGIAVSGHTPRIRERQVPIPGIPRQWQLCVAHFDDQRMCWREYASSWRDVPAPELDEKSPIPPTLFDASNAARYWQPLGMLDPQRV